MTTGVITLPKARYAAHPEATPVTLPAAFVAPGWAVHRQLLWDDDMERIVRGLAWSATRVESGMRLPAAFRTPAAAKAAALAVNEAFPDIRVRPSGRRLAAIRKWWGEHRREFDILEETP